MTPWMRRSSSSRMRSARSPGDSAAVVETQRPGGRVDGAVDGVIQRPAASSTACRSAQCSIRVLPASASLWVGGARRRRRDRRLEVAQPEVAVAVARRGHGVTDEARRVQSRRPLERRRGRPDADSEGPR